MRSARAPIRHGSPCPTPASPPRRSQSLSIPPGLAAGTYSATVTVVSATPGSSAQQFHVVLKVTNDPVISANVIKLTFPYQIGQSAPASQSIRVTSSTGVPLNYSASLATTSCGSWLLLNNGTNTINGLTDDTLVVSHRHRRPDRRATCDGTITIAATVPCDRRTRREQPADHSGEAICFYYRATLLSPPRTCSSLPSG